MEDSNGMGWDDFWIGWLVKNVKPFLGDSMGDHGFNGDEMGIKISRDIRVRKFWLSKGSCFIINKKIMFMIKIRLPCWERSHIPPNVKRKSSTQN